MADSVEEQIVATEHMDEQIVDTPVEEQMPSKAPVQDQAVPDSPAARDRNSVVLDENPAEHHQVQDHNTVVENPIEHHVEDNNEVVENPFEHQVGDPNDVVGNPIEHHQAEDHNDVVEDNSAVEGNPMEHHQVEDRDAEVENSMEDHNAVVENSIEHHQVEDHNAVVENPAEHQAEDQNAMEGNPMEHHHVEDHNAVVENSIEHHHIEEQMVEHQEMANHHVVEEEHRMVSDEHCMVSDEHRMVSDEHRMVSDEHRMVSDEQHMVSDEHRMVSDEHRMVSDEHRMVSDEHHMVSDEQMGSVQLEEQGQMVTVAHQLREDQMESVQLEEQGQMGLAIVAEEKLAMTPYEQQPGSKRRKKKSIVWEHFTIETVGEGCRRACCNQCKQSFAYSTGSKVAGTSHLKRHIAKGTCGLSTPSSRGSDPPRRRYRTASAAHSPAPFDPDRCRHEVARMIIMHDYPLHLVEHPGFLTFVRNLQPNFQMVSFNAVQGDCVATYLMEKQNLMKLVDAIPGRVCLSLDMWTSSQSVGYVFVTGHFIDSEWKLQRRLLNVVMEPYPDSDAALGHAVAVCLHDWSLENRLFSITLGQRQREPALENLRPQLTVKNPLVLSGQLVLGSCLARTLCSVAMDVLEEGKDVVRKVRESVKHVKTSESHGEKFSELRQQLRVPSEKNLSVDDQTRWDTTYYMLGAASELKEVFSLLDTSDPDYKSAPTRDDWIRIETLCSNLKLLHDSAAILSGGGNPTPITFFHEVWKIQTELSRATVESDEFSAAVAQRAKERVEQYWKENSLALAAAVVMDPRFKMKLVEFSFNKLYGEDAPAFIKVVDDGIHELFDEYVALPLPLTPVFAEEEGARSGTATSPLMSASENGLTDFDLYIMETASQQTKSEVDQYLDEALLSRVHDFDVLMWWRLNKPKYPTLSKMARDILSIAVSAVPPESVFFTGAREMDSYRSSLRPETVEALICAKDWILHAAPSDAPSNALLKMEY